MSILSRNSSSTNMGSPSFHEFKKQASFFFKEKIKSARLALTDVTPIELLTEEATSGNPWTPDAKTMNSISRAAFEVDDYWRIIGILHQRLSKFERKNWRVSYNSVVLLEYLLTHGPESSSGEFQSHKDVIQELQSFQYIDEKGFNWGLVVRKKAEKTSKLLENDVLLKEERDRARKLTRGIQGFGSFAQRSSSSLMKSILRESSLDGKFARSNSQFNYYENDENQPTYSYSNEQILVPQIEKSENPPADQTSFKENTNPDGEDLHKWNFKEESSELLQGRRDEESKVEVSGEDDHPFNEPKKQATVSLL